MSRLSLQHFISSTTKSRVQILLEKFTDLNGHLQSKIYLGKKNGTSVGFKK
jgi:hypothetical protein